MEMYTEYHQWFLISEKNNWDTLRSSILFKLFEGLNEWHLFFSHSVMLQPGPPDVLSGGCLLPYPPSGGSNLFGEPFEFAVTGVGYVTYPDPKFCQVVGPKKLLSHVKLTAKLELSIWFHHIALSESELLVRSESSKTLPTFGRPWSNYAGHVKIYP